MFFFVTLKIETVVLIMITKQILANIYFDSSEEQRRNRTKQANKKKQEQFFLGKITSVSSNDS